jgi:hypothetical protein
MIFILFILTACVSNNKYISRFSFIIALVALAFCIRLVWIIKIPTPIESDFALMYNGALYVAKGDYSFVQQSYFTTWVYQLGFTIYESLIIRIFHEGTMVLKLLNILYCIGITVIIYFIASEVFNEWCGRIASVIYALNIPNILYGSVLTNQHLATLFFYFTCYLLVSKYFKHKYIWIFASVTLTLGDIIRPLGYFFLLAVAIYFVIREISTANKTDKFNTVKKILGIVALFYMFHCIISYSFIASGVTKYHLVNRDPLWKFVLGFNHETSGNYSQADVDYLMAIEDISQRQNEERIIIKERTENKVKLLYLLCKKFSIMWGGVDASGYWSLNALNKINLENTLMKYERLIYITTVLFGIIGLIFLIMKNNNSYHYLLFLLLIIGYIIIHLFIEIQTRYRYDIIPSFAIIQSYGVYTAYNIYSFIVKSRVNCKMLKNKSD